MTSFSGIARPPIRPEEAQGARETICPYHGGIIGKMPTKGDKEGNVYYCPLGKQYWRWTPTQRNGMYAPLPYKQSKPV